MKRLALIVEGPTDKAFFLSLAPWFNTLGFLPVVYTAGDKGKLLRAADRHIATARSAGCDTIAFVLDQHDDPCAPTTAANLTHLLSKDVLVAVVCRSLEAWLLADDEAIKRASGRTCSRNGFTDHLADPARTIHDHFRICNKHSLTKTEICEKVKVHFDPTRARGRNLSWSRFIDRLGAAGTV